MVVREIVKSRARMLERAAPILHRLPRVAVMVEVGVSSGILAEHLLQQRDHLEWHGVDNWLGAGQQPRAYVRSGDAHAALTTDQAAELMGLAERRVRLFGDRAVIHHESSPAAAKRFWPWTIDLAFLDADHSFEGTSADVAGWWPVVKRGGWLGGHDWENPDPRFDFGVRRAVEEFVEREGVDVELDTGMTWWIRKP